MPTYARLTKAPIVLALLQVQFRSSADSVTKLGGVKEVLKATYPHHLVQNAAQVSINEFAQITQTGVAPDAYSFVSESRKHEITISLDKFTFAQHGAYEDWASFKKMALDGWNKVRPLIQLTEINRLSIRYINSLEISSRSNKNEAAPKLLHTYIGYSGPAGEIGKTPISTYFLRYTHQDDDRKTTVHFGQQLRSDVTKDEVFPFIVDIDVLRATAGQPSNADIEKQFDELRDLKNFYFFNNLTESTLNQIK
jgi:uncharacterized protein (TIGR04255 family)